MATLKRLVVQTVPVRFIAVCFILCNDHRSSTGYSCKGFHVGTGVVKALKRLNARLISCHLVRYTTLRICTSTILLLTGRSARSLKLSREHRHDPLPLPLRHHLARPVHALHIFRRHRSDPTKGVLAAMKGRL